MTSCRAPEPPAGRRRLTRLAVMLASLLGAGMPAAAAPWAYIANQGSNDVSVILLASQRVVATAPVSRSPAGVFAANRTGKIYVSNPDSNFDALKDWHLAVEASPADQGNAEGSERRVGLKDGGALLVTNYTSTLSVSGQGNTSTVEWHGASYSGYPSNDPPPDKNDEAALKAVTDVYRSGLTKLKQLVEGK